MRLKYLLTRMGLYKKDGLLLRLAKKKFSFKRASLSILFINLRKIGLLVNDKTPLHEVEPIVMALATVFEGENFIDDNARRLLLHSLYFRDPFVPHDQWCMDKLYHINVRDKATINLTTIMYDYISFVTGKDFETVKRNLPKVSYEFIKVFYQAVLGFSVEFIYNFELMEGKGVELSLNDLEKFRGYKSEEFMIFKTTDAFKYIRINKDK